MKSDPTNQQRRAKSRRLQRRRAAGIAAAGAVLFPLFGAIPAATAATPATGGALAPAALAGMLPAALPAAPTGVGPVDPDNGYPYWYGDAGAPATATSPALDPVRLELCLVVAECAAAAPEVGVDPGYDQSQPLTIPGNFPEEAFWWSGEASMTLKGGAEARLVMAQEAAFGGDGSVAAGQQNAFSRIRVRIDDAVPGGTYTVTHPYGKLELTADERGRVRFTEDIGCLQQPCTWDEPTEGKVGPFLRWSNNEAPAGTVGDPNVPHAVVGSPNNTNYFRVKGPNSTGAIVIDRTSQFAVMGQIATLKADVDKPGGLYNQNQDIKIQASFPHESKIVWTTDGTDPTVGPDGTVTNGEVYTPVEGEINPAATVSLASPGTHTLKFIAVDIATGDATEIFTEQYELDPTSPWVEATPAATAPLAGPQTVTLTGTTPNVYYTTDGSVPQYTAAGEPTGSTKVYTEPLFITSSTILRTVAVDEAGNPGEVRTLPYKIHNLQAIGDLGVHGFPTTLTDNGWEGQAPVTLDLCLDDPLCPNVDARPNPNLPTSWPNNFPAEAFWWAADAEMDIAGEDVRLVLASEAAFALDEPKEGDQIAFGRIRVRGDSVFTPGATFLVTHPYGTVRLTADAEGNLNYTEDLGAMNANGNFAPLLEAKIGPFLRWDAGAPAGYLGDGATPHTVVGSPYDTNVFKIEQVTDAAGAPLATPELLGQTDQFIVQGRTEGATPPEPVTAPAALHDFNGDTTPDVIARTADGTLRLYPADAAGNLQAFTVLGTGWNNMTAILSAGDFNTDGNADVLARRGDGTLWLYPGDGLGGLQPRVQVGTGWNNMTALLSTADFNGDGNSDIMARRGDGTLWLYPGDGAGNLQARSQSGTGWDAMTELASPGDFNSDGNADILARDGNGILWLYTGDGAGKLSARVQAGTGWNNMTAIFSAGDINGDGNSDLLARHQDGTLYLYPGDGTGQLQPRSVHGTGWNGMTAIF